MATRPDHLRDEADEGASEGAETGQTGSLNEAGLISKFWMRVALVGFVGLALPNCGEAGRERAEEAEVAGDLKLYNGISYLMAGKNGIDFSTQFEEPVTLSISVFSPNGARLFQEEYSVNAGSDSVSMAFIPEVPVGSRIVISKPGSRSFFVRVLDSAMPTFSEGS